MPYSPDVLDHLGLAIAEVGGVQVAIESSRLFWPSGEVRVALLVQAAWSGPLVAELELQGPSVVLKRTVHVADAEVRRFRLVFALADGVEPLRMKLRSSIPEGASRVRAAWLKESAPAESASALGALVGAFRQAVGKREKRPEVRAPGEVEIAVPLAAIGGAAPVAAEDEVVWQPGMPEPEQRSGLRVDELVPPMSTARRTQAHGDKLECPHCFAPAYAEAVRGSMRCPSCDHAWHL